MSRLSRDARALIEAARPHERATDDERRRVRDRVLRRAGAGAAALATIAASSTVGTAAGAPAAALGGGLLAKIAIGIAVVAAVGGGGALALSPSAPPPDVARAAAPQIERTVTELRASSTLVPAVQEEPPAAPPEPPIAPQPAPPSAPVSAALATRPLPSAAVRQGLEGELDLLRGAQEELRSGRAGRALELLDAHEKQFGGGALREERQAARVLALCKAGRVAEARVAAEAFLRESPESPQASRVRTACAAP